MFWMNCSFISEEGAALLGYWKHWECKETINKTSGPQVFEQSGFEGI